MAKRRASEQFFINSEFNADSLHFKQIETQFNELEGSIEAEHYKVKSDLSKVKMSYKELESKRMFLEHIKLLSANADGFPNDQETSTNQELKEQKAILRGIKEKKKEKQQEILQTLDKCISALQQTQHAATQYDDKFETMQTLVSKCDQDIISLKENRAPVADNSSSTPPTPLVSVPNSKTEQLSQLTRALSFLQGVEVIDATIFVANRLLKLKITDKGHILTIYQGLKQKRKRSQPTPSLLCYWIEMVDLVPNDLVKEELDDIVRYAKLYNDIGFLVREIQYRLQWK